MKKEITLGNLLAILVPTFIIILTWGGNLQTQLKEHSIRIQTLERNNGKVEAKLERIENLQTQILVELQNKKNRED